MSHSHRSGVTPKAISSRNFLLWLRTRSRSVFGSDTGPVRAYAIPLMVAGKTMRYLFLGLILFLTACGTISDRSTVQRMNQIVSDCERRGQSGKPPESDVQLQCVAAAVLERCQDRYQAGILTGEEDWIDCISPELAKYCQSFFPLDDPAFAQCVSDGSDSAIKNDPFVELVANALETVRNECDRLHKTGELSTWVAKAQCLNDGHSKIFRQYKYFYFPAARRRVTRKRMELAERRDAGTITDAEATREMAEFTELCFELHIPPECSSPK